MASKSELQSQLKALHNINKNISDSLSRDECADLIEQLSLGTSLNKLVEAYAEKNAALGKNNATIGGDRSRAKKKLETLQAEYAALEASIDTLESTNQALTSRKQQLETDRLILSAEVERITVENTALETQVTNLNLFADKLTDVNDELKKENKTLKNLIDAIRLQLARDVKNLLRYEDSEIRKALVKVFKSTLG